MDGSREIYEEVLKVRIVAAKYNRFFRRHGQKRPIQRKVVKGIVDSILHRSDVSKHYGQNTLRSSKGKEMAESVAFCTSAKVGSDLFKLLREFSTVSGIVIDDSSETEGSSIGGMVIFPNPNTLPTLPTNFSTSEMISCCAAEASLRIFFSIVSSEELRNVMVSSAAVVTAEILPRTAKVNRHK